MRVPSWSAETPSMPLCDPPVEEARTWQNVSLPPRRLVDFCSIIKPFIHAISQPCPLQGGARVRACVWRVRGGAWGVGCWRRPCGLGSRAPTWPSRLPGALFMLFAACRFWFCSERGATSVFCVSLLSVGRFPSVPSCRLQRFSLRSLGRRVRPPSRKRNRVLCRVPDDDSVELRQQFPPLLLDSES